MNLWFAKGAVIFCFLAYCVIRAPHGNRSKTVPIAENRLGKLDAWLLLGAFVGTTLIPLVWAATGFPSGTDYPLHPALYAVGIALMLAGLWLFHRSHVDLGTNWSITLQVRENHRLVTNGIYRKIRHPMYASMFLLGIAHLLFVPNWIVGPAYLASFWLLYAIRVGREERMMLDRFGAEYEEYRRRTGRVMPKRSVPGGQ
jgi:protein-S-isoprenylcysteine O-methyltransferase Ste14